MNTKITATIQQPILFAKVFILIPVNLQTTFVYLAHTGELMGIINQHKKVVKWASAHFPMHGPFREEADNLTGQLSTKGLELEFEQTLGDTRIEMIPVSNIFDFL